MNILPVLNQIIMLALVMGVGLVMRKIDVLQDAVIKGANRLIMTVTWPALMILTTQKDFSPEILKTYLAIMIGSGLMMAVLSLLLARAYKNRFKDVAAAMSMLSVLPNAGFFGIPIIEAMYGSQGLLFLSAYIMGFNLVLWSVSVSTFSGFSVKNLKGLINPGLMGSVIGLTLFLLRIHLPTPLFSTVSQLAAINTPLSMLILGARMEALRPRQLLDARLWLTQSIKLIALPLITLFVLRLMGVTGEALVIFVACTAMPSAVSVQMFTERFGGDVYFSAKGTSTSTLCSLVTLPLMIWLTGLVAG